VVRTSPRSQLFFRPYMVRFLLHNSLGCGGRPDTDRLRQPTWTICAATKTVHPPLGSFPAVNVPLISAFSIPVVAPGIFS